MTSDAEVTFSTPKNIRTPVEDELTPLKVTENINTNISPITAAVVDKIDIISDTNKKTDINKAEVISGLGSANAVKNEEIKIKSARKEDEASSKPPVTNASTLEVGDVGICGVVNCIIFK